jgi:hypothetical protein
MHFEGPYKKLKDAPDKRDAVIRDLAQLIAPAQFSQSGKSNGDRNT